MATSSSNPKPVGLVLAGGHSRRYGSDKALARVVNDQPNVLLAVQRLLPHCQRVVVSVNNHNQAAVRACLGTLENVSLVTDSPTFADQGPLSGILAASLTMAGPTSLVVTAVDYPSLPQAGLTALVTHQPFYLQDPNRAHFTLAHLLIDPLVVTNWVRHHSRHRLQDFLRAQGCQPLVIDQPLTNLNYEVSQ